MKDEGRKTVAVDQRLKAEVAFGPRSSLFSLRFSSFVLRPSSFVPRVATPALLAACLLLSACAAAHQRARESFDQREHAFRLIDEADRLEDGGSRLLALERLQRATWIYESPRALFEMGRLFEAYEDDPKAATAYQQALRLAPDFQEARLAMLALGFTPEGYMPTQNDLALARTWAAGHAATLDAVEATTAGRTLSEALREQQRQALREEAAARRMPTLAEVRAVLFAPRTEPAAPTASAPAAAQAADRDVVLGTYDYHFARAERLGRQEAYERAAEEYENAIVADPQRIEARLALGDMMLRIERYPRALFYYQRALEDFPQSPEPLFKMGNYYLAIQQNERASEFFRRALAIDPGMVKAANNLAYMAMKDRDYAAAAALLDDIIQMDPLYANAYLNRGIIALEVEQDPAAALENYRKYVDLEGERSEEVRRWIADLQSRRP
jgi:tetratricopeptide (TPR) repeat protein